MMRSTFQAMLLSAAIAIEAETEVESQATYGMTITGSLPIPKPDAIVFPTNLTVGGGSVLPPVQPAIIDVLKAKLGTQTAFWQTWKTLSWNEKTRLDHEGEKYYVGTIKNPSGESKVVELAWGADYTGLVGPPKFTLAPGASSFIAAKKNDKSKPFKWSGLYTVKVTSAPAVVVPVVPVAPVVTVVPVALTKEQIVAKVLAKNADSSCASWRGMKVCYQKRVTIEGDDADYFVESIENSKSTTQTLKFTWKPEWTLINPASTSFNLAPGAKETNIARYNTKGGAFTWSLYSLKISEHVSEAMTGNGEDYRGAQTKTVSGKECQNWSSQWPNRHTFAPSAYPQSDLSDNRCRNPDGDATIWCFTKDTSAKNKWEKCLPLV